MNANLSRLERFVERELYFREAAEQMVPDSVTKEEVIDEVIAAALGDGGDKPDKIALEPWLYRLAIHAIGDLQARSSDNVLSVHLEDSARVPNVRASDEPELQFHQPDETLTRESVIADRRVATPEEIASSDEINSLVEFALAAAKPRDREVFILHTIEGFSRGGNRCHHRSQAGGDQRLDHRPPANTCGARHLSPTVSETGCFRTPALTDRGGTGKGVE